MIISLFYSQRWLLILFMGLKLKYVHIIWTLTPSIFPPGLKIPLTAEISLMKIRSVGSLLVHATHVGPPGCCSPVGYEDLSTLSFNCISIIVV